MKKYNVNFFLIIILFLMISFVFVHKTEAQTPPELGHFGGYAWSPNIGWIDMKGVSFNAPLTKELAFLAPPINLSGYAWSPNVGWISFQETSNCPAGDCQAKINIPNQGIFGWAKVLSLTTLNSENNDQEYNSNGVAEDWASGWIKLNNSPYAGTECLILTGGTSGTGGGPNGFLAGTCNGYAWGSRAIGWINFSKVTTGFYAGSDANVFLFADNLGGNPVTGPVVLPTNSSVHLTWSGTNLSQSIPNCNLVYTYNDGPSIPLPPLIAGQIWTLSWQSPSFQHTGTSGLGLPNGIYKYRMACAGSGSNNGWSNLLFVSIGTEIATVDLQSPYCNTLIASASNIPNGSQCTGTAIEKLGGSTLPPWPEVNNVPSGEYSLKCGGIEKWATVFEPGINCTTPPSSGGKKPIYKEN